MEHADDLMVARVADRRRRDHEFVTIGADRFHGGLAIERAGDRGVVKRSAAERGAGVGNDDAVHRDQADEMLAAAEIGHRGGVDRKHLLAVLADGDGRQREIGLIAHGHFEILVKHDPQGDVDARAEAEQCGREQTRIPSGQAPANWKSMHIKRPGLVDTPRREPSESIRPDRGRSAFFAESECGHRSRWSRWGNRNPKRAPRSWSASTPG